MNCPACRQLLLVIERERVELDWCLACRGLWFDHGELELLAELSGRRLDPEDVGAGIGGPAGETSRPCPRCDRKMEKAWVGHDEPVQIDRCRLHGVWLDHGELSRIISQLPPGSDTDEAVILRFLGETFRRPARPPADGP